MMNHQIRAHVVSMILCRAANRLVEYERPFQMSPDSRAYSDIRKRLDDLITFDHIQDSSLASSILRPRSEVTAEDIATIPSGWGARRFRFSMVLELDQSNGFMSYIVSGYTDQDDISHQGTIDPQMRFYFNSVQILRESRAATGHRDVKNRGNYQVIHASRHDNPNRKDDDYTGRTLVTPSNVLYALSSERAVNQMGYGSDVSRYDLRNQSTLGRGMISRSHTLPGRYMADAINSMVDVLGEASAAMQRHDARDSDATSRSIRRNTSVTNPYERAAVRARIHGGQMNVGQDDLIGALIREGYMSHDGSISYANLAQIAPNLDDIDIHVLSDDGTVMADGVEASRLTEMDCRDWAGRDSATVYAAQLKSTISALMAECQIRRVSLTMTNQTTSGVDDLAIQDVHTLSDFTDTETCLALFTRRVIQEVCPTISENGMQDYVITISNELAGNCRLSISLNGDYPQFFMGASYLDALTTPLASTDRQSLADLAYDFGQLFPTV